MLLKGFPTEISKKIELPDMAELLTMPVFFDTDIEDVYKYGTDFQRKLIDMMPLRNNKNVISVLSQVRILAPKNRSVTGYIDPSKGVEWHIDCEEKEDNNYDYHEDRDVVHLLTNETTAMTEFLAEDIWIDWDHTRPVLDFIDYFDKNVDKWNLPTKAMPANQIVTFTNQLHRATDPQRLEFRYMWRVVETDRTRPAGKYDPFYKTTIVNSQNETVPNIDREGRTIRIFVPEEFNMISVEHEKAMPERRKKPVSPATHVTPVVHSRTPGSMNEIRIDFAFFERELFEYGSDLYQFTPNNVITFLGKHIFTQEENDAFVESIEFIDREATLVDKDGNRTTLNISQKTFYGFDPSPELGQVAGSFIIVPQNIIDRLHAGEEFTIEFNKNAPVHFYSDGELKVSI